MSRFKKQFMEVYDGVKGEVNSLPSKTIPDQSMSVREIMDRFARGLSINDGKVPIYNGESDDMIIPTGDRAEMAYQAEQIKNELKGYKLVKNPRKEKTQEAVVVETKPTAGAEGDKPKD